MRKRMVFLLAMLCLLLSKSIFANTATEGVTKASPIQFEADEYFRLTQPIKDKIAVFDKDVNVTGEARYKTVIKMQLFNKKENERIYPRDAYCTYDLDPVGMSQTFSELIELKQGENKVRFIYSYENKNKELVEGRVVIYITRKSEAEKAAIKNLRIDNTEAFTNGLKNK